MSALYIYNLSFFVSVFDRFCVSGSQSFIGVNYGTYADNLPAPAQTAKLLQSTSIGKVRLYAADPAILKALAGTGIGVVLGTGNGDIPKLASDPKFATQWVESNVLAYYPATKIVVVTIGNEVMTFGDAGLISQLLPAMQNVQDALNAGLYSSFNLSLFSFFWLQNNFVATIGGRVYKSLNQV